MKRETVDTKDIKLPQRLQSLDALRGFDMFFIMGGAALLATLVHLFPTPFFEGLARQMEHASWNGLRHHDTIFPLFLFIAGISFPFSYAKQRAQGKTGGEIYRKIIQRGLVLVFLGVVYNGFLTTLDFVNQRYASVLARIGLAWMFAALIFIRTKTVVRIWLTGGILIGYWGLCMIGAPDAAGADPFSHDGCLAGYIDRLLLPGRLYEGNFDPEGLLSLIPAIATALMGMLTGEWVKRNDVSEGRKVLYMVAAGAVLLVVGLLWSHVFPINKKLWTSTFVCVVGAYSVLMFALFYFLIDVCNLRKWSFPLVVIGMNSITIYLAQAFIHFGYTSEKVFGGFVKLFPQTCQPTLKELFYTLVCWLFLYFLYRKRIFLKV